MTVTGSGYAANSLGSVLQCSGDPTVPMVTLPAPVGQTINVSCQALNILKLTSTNGSGGFTTTWKILSGTVGPPCGPPPAAATCPATDSAGIAPATDAANYPCPPTAAQQAAGVTCYIEYGDATLESAKANFTFAGETTGGAPATTAPAPATTAPPTTAAHTTATTAPVAVAPTTVAPATAPVVAPAARAQHGSPRLHRARARPVDRRDHRFHRPVSGDVAGRPRRPAQQRAVSLGSKVTCGHSSGYRATKRECRWQHRSGPTLLRTLRSAHDGFDRRDSGWGRSLRLRR